MPEQTKSKQLMRDGVWLVPENQRPLGAIEYDPDIEKIKCHECAEWFDALTGNHLKSHGITADQYKARHGINITTGLCTPAFSKVRAVQYKPTADQTARLIEAGRTHKQQHGNNLSNRNAQRERANVIGACQTQTLFRIQTLAAELGRTPTSKELADQHIDQPLLIRHFGSVQNAMEAAGLDWQPRTERRTDGRFGRDDDRGALPLGFPTKEQLLDTRMPWPKEYFGAHRAPAKSPLTGT